MLSLRACHLLVWFRRFLAAGAAAMVLGLGVAAANPSLHAQLHERGSGANGHDHSAPAEGCGSLCAILLVAAGVEPAIATSVSPAPSAELTVAWSVPESVDFVPAPYLRPPERGPPQG